MTSFAPALIATQPAEAPTDTELRHYVDMLGTMRPAGSKAEKRFIAKYIAPLGATPDAHGNYWLVIGPTQVMWSCHTDTVHSQGGEQNLCLNEGVITAPKSSCLGADCTTGVWIMRQMILARVPGVYIFHRAEECGGIGSSAIARRGDERLDGVKFAIAFDRKGKSSVITHQLGSRCASQAFVNSIAPMLPGDYRADDAGTFTDTASYTDMISECTNISVGYYDQHTSRESQDLIHAWNLAEAMKVFDESRLVAERDPRKDDDFEWAPGWQDRVGSTAGRYVRAAEAQDPNAEWDHAAPRDMLSLVREYPHEIADLLEQHGYDVQTLLSEISAYQ